MEITDFFKKIKIELNDNLTGQRRRYLESYQEELGQYIINHPDRTEVPSHFELYCDLHPDAPECLKYDI